MLLSRELFILFIFYLQEKELLTLAKRKLPMGKCQLNVDKRESSSIIIWKISAEA